MGAGQKGKREKEREKERRGVQNEKKGSKRRLGRDWQWAKGIMSEGSERAERQKGKRRKGKKMRRRKGKGKRSGTKRKRDDWE